MPTLQRNALRKIFGRSEFSPEEVVALGYRRLQQAEGIGTKGLSTILEWLHAHGHDLVVAPPSRPRRSGVRTGQDVDQAIRLLRQNGYDVLRRE
ncbi:hypothetical protein [Rhodocyclus gracilis]|uniref:Uncharacterized protein n=1 Tax=Rhodocyclus tenuis TaxID=1066 RepID=A0A6L5JTS6_RHOTE|nr:hypothetical protein [Rhodocyclus gracilis]MQY50805.1 hypothetical protein [Rhodocyclus gracilis]